MVDFDLRSFYCCLLALIGLLGVLICVLLPVPVLCFVPPMGSGVLIFFAVLEFSLFLVVVCVVADPFLLVLIPPPVLNGLTRRRLHLTSGFRFFGSPCFFPFGRGYLFAVMLLGCFGRSMAGRMAYMAGNLGILLFSFRLQIGLYAHLLVCVAVPCFNT